MDTCFEMERLLKSQSDRFYVLKSESAKVKTFSRKTSLVFEKQLSSQQRNQSLVMLNIFVHACKLAFQSMQLKRSDGSSFGRKNFLDHIGGVTALIRTVTSRTILLSTCL